MRWWAATLGLIAMLAVAWLHPQSVDAQAPVIGQGGAAPCPPLVNRGPHVYVGCVKPASMSAGCGVTNAGFTYGSDVAGRLSLGDDYVAGTTCTVTFAVPWLAAPACVVSPSGTGITLTNVNVNTTLFNFQMSGTGKASWVCIGSQPP